MRLLRRIKQKRNNDRWSKVDDILICYPGDKIAVDGIVVSGKTHVNESFITGESKPVLKEKNSTVIAGSINYDVLLLSS